MGATPGVFRTAQLTWRGATYEFTPSMSLLRSIEMQGISLMHIEWQAATGKPQGSLMALVMALVMKHAGVDVAEDEIYQELRSGNPVETLQLYRDVMAALMPEEKPQKKDEPEAAE